MSNYVCSNAKLKCSMGDSTATLSVLPDRMIQMEGEYMANIMDNQPMINIQPFGQCQSMANPMVAAATAANYGRLQPMPCIPNTVAPWMPGESAVLVKGQPALMDNCKLQCMWAGMIEITDSGQKNAEPDSVNSRGHGFDAHGFGKLFDHAFSL